MDSIIHTSVSLGKTIIKVAYYLIALYGLGLIIFWWSDDQVPIKTLKITASKYHVAPGESLTSEQHIQKLRTCRGTVSRYIRGDCGFLDIPSIDTALREGTHAIRVPVTIPTNFIPGSCYFFSIHRFTCNPVDYILDRHTIVSDPVNFFVEPGRL